MIQNYCTEKDTCPLSHTLFVSQREGKNNQLEVSLRYTPGNPEEGEGDSLSIEVNKLRWSLEATKEYEQKNGLLSFIFLDFH